MALTRSARGGVPGGRRSAELGGTSTRCEQAVVAGSNPLHGRSRERRRHTPSSNQRAHAVREPDQEARDEVAGERERALQHQAREEGGLEDRIPADTAAVRDGFDELEERERDRRETGELDGDGARTG
jgi:hypothetical protein